jgi:hypothetical protein
MYSGPNGALWQLRRKVQTALNVSDPFEHPSPEGLGGEGGTSAERRNPPVDLYDTLDSLSSILLQDAEDAYSISYEVV